MKLVVLTVMYLFNSKFVHTVSLMLDTRLVLAYLLMSGQNKFIM